MGQSKNWCNWDNLKIRKNVSDGDQRNKNPNTESQPDDSSTSTPIEKNGENEKNELSEKNEKNEKSFKKKKSDHQTDGHVSLENTADRLEGNPRDETPKIETPKVESSRNESSWDEESSFGGYEEESPKQVATHTASLTLENIANVQYVSLNEKKNRDLKRASRNSIYIH